MVSETDSYARNWQGAGAPLVTGINDYQAPSFDSFDFPLGKTVCRTGVPYRDCGLRIEDAGVGWAIHFDRSQVSSSPGIRSEAVRLIKSYRRVGNAKGPTRP